MKSIEEIIGERKRIAKRNIVYMDKDRNIVKKEQATIVVVTEYDKDGHIINETWGECNVKSKNDSNQDEREQ